MWDEKIVQGQPRPIATSAGIKPVWYLIRKLHLYQISSKICNAVLVARQDNPTALHRLDAAIRAELDPLEQSYASMLGANLSIVLINLLLSFAHHLVLLLHSNILNEASLYKSQHGQSKQRCMESAQRVLKLHADFHQLLQLTPCH